ncbi:MAG TPA: type I-U CRISPR-associated protein Csb2 [Noviherbaspirillum sp.]
MIAIGIRYLNGWSMAAAADGSDKATAEWPPHPDRLFMALAAAYFETDRDPAERAALLWLEQQAAPRLYASMGGEVSRRAIVTHYVPVNDVAPPRSAENATAKQVAEGLLLLPERRLRQARQFPVVVPQNDTVYFIWPDAEPDEDIRAALATLCAKLTCLGHSASLVQGWIEPEPPAPTMQPTRSAGLPLRVAETGRLAQLEQAYNESERLAWIALESATATAKGAARKKLREERDARFGKGAPQSRRPSPATSVAYASVKPERPPLPHTVFSDRLLMFRQVARRPSREGVDMPSKEHAVPQDKRLWLDNMPLLMAAWRNTVMAHSQVQPPPEWLCGHRTDGTPTTQSHLAVLPIANVANPHAQGHVMGVALAIPRDVPDNEVGRCLWPLFDLGPDGNPKPLRIYHGSDFDIDVVFDLGESEREAFRAQRWCGDAGGARVWASVTPVALDRHSKHGRFDDGTKEQIAHACTRIGLPRPTKILISSTGFLTGVPHARSVPALRRKDGSARQQVHVCLEFPEAVQGPVLIGAGRFRGYGLCMPYRRDKA